MKRDAGGRPGSAGILRTLFLIVLAFMLFIRLVLLLSRASGPSPCSHEPCTTSVIPPVTWIGGEIRGTSEEGVVRLAVLSDEESGEALQRLIRSLSQCEFETEGTILLDVHRVGVAASSWDSVMDKINWPHGPVRFFFDHSAFDALLDAWRTYPGSREKFVLLEEGCSVCDCQFLSQLNVVGTHFQREGSIQGSGLGPVPGRNEAVLAASIPSTCGYSPLSPSVWMDFVSYLDASRKEHFTWPLRDSSAVGDWTAWLTRFSSEYRLHSFFPPQSWLKPQGQDCESVGGTPSVTAEVLATARWSIRLDSAYRPEPVREPFAVVDVDDKEVDALVDYGRAQGGDFVSLTVVNEVFLETAHSWLCNVRELGIQPPALVWVTTDQKSFDELSKIEGTKALRFGLQGGKETGNDYGQPGYWRLMLERTLLFRKVLERGVAIFAFETDQIWLENPLPYVMELVQDGADVVGTMDSRNEIGGNLLYLRPSVHFVKLWAEVYRRFSDFYTKAGLSGKARDSYTYIPNDQSQLTALVLYDVEFRRKYSVVFHALNTERFVDGRWYDNHYKSSESKYPVLINNNFLIGVQKKAERAKKFKHWFVDNKTGQCLRNVVHQAAKRPSSAQKSDADDLGQHLSFQSKQAMSLLTAGHT